MELNDRIESELTAAETAWSTGNPGRARVCARRAAGLGIRAYYQRRDGPAWSGDAMKQLIRLRMDPAAPAPVRLAAERLTTQVDLDHQLPFDEAPIEDARRILNFVAPQPRGGPTR